MRREHAGVHHIDDRAGAAILAQEVPVEIAADLIEAVEVPKDILGLAVAAAAEACDLVLGGVEGNFGFFAVGGNHLGSERCRGERHEYSSHCSTREGPSQMDLPACFASWTGDASTRVKQTPPKDKKILTVKRVAIFVAVFAVSLVLRVCGPRPIVQY